MSIKITVDGHLTKAPELRKTTSCKSVTRFDLAHNFREHVGKDFSDVATIFFSASVWEEEEDGAVEVAELGLTKGSRVSVDGLWSKRTWITKDGERRINDVLTVTSLEALDTGSIDMSCLLIIGSSHTRLGHGAAVWTNRSHSSMISR